MLCIAYHFYYTNLRFNQKQIEYLKFLVLDVVFSFGLQYLLLDVKIDLLGFIGAVCVCGGTFLIIFFKLFESDFKKMCFLKWLISKF